MSEPVRSELAITAQALKASGGAERYTRDVIAGLHRQGIRPILFAREIDTSLEEAAWIDPQPLNVRWAPRKLRNLAFNWRLKRRLKDARPRCVFAINHSPYADIALCGGTHPGSLEATGRRAGIGDRLQFALERRTYTNARRIVAHSELMKRELIRYYEIDANKIDVIYPPVDADRFRPLDVDARAAARRHFNLPDDRIVFAFSSTSHARKGYGLIEKFFTQTKLPVCVVIAGRPVAQTSDTIRYAGYCRDIGLLFAAADFTLIPSIYEPFGLVGVESVLCGTPVVVASNVGSAETIGAEAKIEFSRDDADGFAHAIHAAIARVQTGKARLSTPRQHLVYDPDVDAHVAALINLCRSGEANQVQISGPQCDNGV